MNTPDSPSLPKGVLPLAALAGGLLLLHRMSSDSRDAVLRNNANNALRRETASLQNSGINASMRPMGMDPLSTAAMYRERYSPDDPMFFGKEAGMLGVLNKAPNLLVRGAQQAGKATLGKMPSMGLLPKAAIGAGAVGTALLASKALGRASAAGLAPPEARQQNTTSFQAPRYTNQYGVPGE